MIESGEKTWGFKEKLREERENEWARRCCNVFTDMIISLSYK